MGLSTHYCYYIVRNSLRDTCLPSRLTLLCITRSFLDGLLSTFAIYKAIYEIYCLDNVSLEAANVAGVSILIDFDGV